MNFRRNLDEVEHSFHIAPLLDVVFIVLVFFVVITAMEQSERELEVKPPVASGGSQIKRNQYELVINVKEDGTITLFNEEWNVHKLRERLKMLMATGGPESSVMIRADALTAHQNVVSVIDACRAAHITRFSYVIVENAQDAELAENRDGSQ